KIIQWKPLEIESVEAKVFWEVVICTCNEVVTQLINSIRLVAEFQQTLSGVRFGIADFVERCLYGENVPFAIQGLNIQLDKFKEYVNKVYLFIEKTEKEVDNSVRQTFDNEGSKEAEEISKQLLDILEKLKKAEEKKQEFRKKEEETSKKIEEIMKTIAKKQADKHSCDQEALNNEIDILKKQKYDLIKRTNEEMKEIEKKIDNIIKEKEKLQDNLSDILKKTGLRSADAVKEFFQAYDKFQHVNYAGLVNIARDTNILGQWFSLKFNTEIKLETLLLSSYLGVFTQPLQTIGINKAIHLCRKGGNFNKDIRSRLEAIDGINPFDIDALEDFCEDLTIDHIKKQQKIKGQSTKMIVDVMIRPLYVFLYHLNDGMQKAQELITIEK
ncbi:hypothetical protein RFI_35283, partial [Reticulomyxa filosa]